ncbi:MAG: helix-turn-helix domain-containing protein [Granulosicoccus sp.]
MSREIISSGGPVPLTPIEYLIIDKLFRNRKAAVSMDSLLQVLEGASYESSVPSIQVHIDALRKKLTPGKIKTIRGMGYRLDRKDLVGNINFKCVIRRQT